MNQLQAILLAFAALAIVGCRTQAPTPVFVDGNLGPAAPDLQRLEKSGFSRAWMRPDASFASYDGVHLMFPDVQYRTPPLYPPNAAFGLDNYSFSEAFTTEFMSALEQSFRNELTAEDGWRPTAPEPNAEQAQHTLVIRVSLINLIVHAPLELFAGDTFSWVDSIGSVTVVIDLYDPSNQRVVARFAERRLVAPASRRVMRANPGPTLYESRQIFQLWARKLRLALEAMTTTDGTTAVQSGQPTASDRFNPGQPRPG
jgi:hypothetical protein